MVSAWPSRSEFRSREGPLHWWAGRERELEPQRVKRQSGRGSCLSVPGVLLLTAINPMRSPSVLHFVS